MLCAMLDQNDETNPLDALPTSEQLRDRLTAIVTEAKFLRRMIRLTERIARERNESIEKSQKGVNQ